MATQPESKFNKRINVLTLNFEATNEKIIKFITKKKYIYILTIMKQ